MERDDRDSSPEDALERGLLAAFGPGEHSGEPDFVSSFVDLEESGGALVALRPLPFETGSSRAAGPALKPLPPDAPGPVLAAGKYRVEGEIARGGIGVVLKGQDTELGREVALKFLHEKHRSNPVLLRRFLEEARIAGQLQHPGIVPVYEIARAEGRPFFSMKLIAGHTLAELLEERPDPAHQRRRFLVIFEQVCQTVAYAHARGVIHRDLKPSNVMVGAFGEVQVVDWGLAKVLAEEQAVLRPGSPAPRPDRTARGDLAPERATRADSSALPPSGRASSSASSPGSVLGTPAYMPPEQALGEIAQMDERSDVFSVGAILCEILTGEPPYLGDTVEAILQKASRGHIEDARRRLLACGADEELAQLAIDCLSPGRAARPPDAGAVAARIGRYLADLEAKAQAARIAAAEERVKAQAARRSQRLTAGLAASVLLTILVGGGGYFWMESDRARRAAHAAQAIESALSEAQRRRGEALANATGGLEAWAHALAAARRAEVLVGSAPVGAEIEARVRASLLDLEREESEARARDLRRRKDREMLDRLEEIPIPAQDFDLASLAQLDARRRADAYAQAFREQGIAVEPTGPADPAANVAAMAAVRESSIARELTAALVDWAFALRGLEGSDPSTGRNLLEVAREANPSSWRDRLVEALLAATRTEAEREATFVSLRALAEEAGKAETPASTVVLLAKALRDRGARNEALSLLRAARALRPQDVSLALELGLFLERLPEPPWPEAVGAYRSALALRPDNREVRRRLAYYLTRAGEGEDALAILGKIIEAHPDDDRAFLLRANALHSLMWKSKGKAKERVAEAVAACRGAVQLNPDSALARANLANFLWQLAYFDRDEAHRTEGLAECEEAIRRAPRLAFARKTKGDVLSQIERFEEAVASYREAVDLEPEYAEAFENLAVALGNAARWEEAVHAWEEAVRLTPAKGDARSGLGAALLRLPGRLDEATRAFREAIQLQPASFRTHHRLGFALEMAGAIDEAIAEYREAVRLEPRAADVYRDLGYALGRRGRFAAALKALEEAQKRSRGPDARLERKIAATRALVEREEVLLSIVAGRAVPADPREALLAARLAFARGRPFAAAELFAVAFSSDPTLGEDLEGGARAEAAGAAALAGTGKGNDAADPPPEERGEWRRQALVWLRADFAARVKELEANAGDRSAWEDFEEAIERRQLDPDFAGVRDPAALEGLPPAERAEWRAFWDELNDHLALRPR
jgi:serine/threonine protein kinase/Flp pilus assembly protein TadD